MIRLSIVFISILVARLLSSFFNPIDDCDEVYNFYEPLHFINYGYAFQTWEYAPEFALRSYAYILFHWLPISWISIEHKKWAFYCLRIFLSSICALCETLFYKSIGHQLNESTSRIYFLLSLFNVGLFRSSSAFINNSFSMYSILLAYSFWLLNKLFLSVLFIGIGSLFGWIYLVVLGIPIAADIVFRRGQLWNLIKWTLVSGLSILVPMTIVDSYYYGKLVIAPLNHVVYNVFSSHGPTLYGKEPWIYYVKNGFLNFNIVYPLSMMGIIFSVFFDLFWDHRSIQLKKAAIPYWMLVCPLVLWMSLLWSQEHKEDRFVFPIYPLILLSSSISLDQIKSLIGRWSRWFGLKVELIPSLRSLLVYSVILVHATLSLSRTWSIVDGFSSPIRLLNHQNSSLFFAENSNQTLEICLGKDWFRFPSHFLIANEFQVSFVRSEFRGQLPKAYDHSPFPSRVTNRSFNDENREELDRFIDPSQCHCLIDHDRPAPSQLEPNFSQFCRQVTSVEMNLPPDSNDKSSFFRSFYVPWLSFGTRKRTLIHLLDCRRTNISSKLDSIEKRDK